MLVSVSEQLAVALSMLTYQVSLQDASSSFLVDRCRALAFWLFSSFDLSKILLNTLKLGIDGMVLRICAFKFQRG